MTARSIFTGESVGHRSAATPDARRPLGSAPGREGRYVRWLFYGSVVVVVGVSLLVGWILWDARRADLEGAGREAENLLALLDEDIRQSISGYDLALQAMTTDIAAETNGLAGADRRGLLLLARAATASYPGRIVESDADGKVVLDTDLKGSPLDRIDPSPVFAFHRDHPSVGLHLSGPIRDPASGRWVLGVSRRLERVGGGFAGVAFGMIDLGYLRDLFYSVDLEPTDGLSLWNFDRTLVLARPYVDRAVGTGADDFGLFARLETGDRGRYLVEGAAGGPRLVAYRQIGDLPLVLAATRSENVVLAGWWRKSFNEAMAACGLIGVAILLGLSSAYEIRRRARAERDLARARAAAEAASDAKSRFLAVMSHELRSPLNAVVGFADMMARGAHGPLGDPHYQGYVADIRSSAGHLLELINDLLDHAKAEANRLEIEEDIVDLGEVVAFAVRMLAPRAERAGIAVSMDVATVPVRGDERRLRQVVINLLTNAIKFTARGGAVTLTCRAEDGARIEVADTGIGMCPADQAKIFEPFHQVRGSRLAGEGTGLGLPLTKRLVELHDGTIEVASRLGAGTTVTVRLPKSRIVPVPRAAAP